MSSNSTNSKSRQALLEAFSTLVLQRPYHEIHVPDIVVRADVSRSTFYQHFSNKDDILQESLGGILDVLADIGFDTEDPALTVRILDHIHEFRSMTTVYLNSTVTPLVVRLLAERVQTRLPRLTSDDRHSFHCFQIAESTLGLTRTWLEHGSPLTLGELATHMRASTRALVDIQQAVLATGQESGVTTSR